MVEHPGVLTPEGNLNLRRSIEEEFTGPENAAKVIVLEEGAKYKQLTIPPEDAQFLQTRLFTVRDIARLICRGQPSVVVLHSPAPGAGAEGQTQA